MAISRSFGATSFTTRSPILMFPLVISSRPARQRRAVVLPQPEGPTSTRNSLSATSIFRLLTAVTSPYFLMTFSNATLAMGLSSVSWEYSDSIILPLLWKENEKLHEFRRKIPNPTRINSFGLRRSKIAAHYWYNLDEK